MFEAQSDEVILKRMLDRISNDIDKREGSLVYNALAPAAQELARMYSDMERFLGYTFAAPNIPEELLDLRVGERGLKRAPSTYAIKKGSFYDEGNNPIDIQINSRFSIEDFNFKAIERISQGVYKMQCETLGVSGNFVTGTLIPIDYVKGLAKAELGELLIPGEETESNESLYDRYIDYLNEKPFGGNVADYKLNTKNIDGVGSVKIFPVWNGGGTVKIVLLDSSYDVPSQELIGVVQSTLDPTSNSGEGIGIVPIGHVVTVEGAHGVEITIDTEVVLRRDFTLGQVQEGIENAIKEYLLNLRKQWNSEDITIRVSQLEAKVLNVEGIADLFNTKINGAPNNLVLGAGEVPTFKVVNLSEKQIN